MVPEVENFLLANDEFKKQDGKKPNKNEKRWTDLILVKIYVEFSKLTQNTLIKLNV